MEAAPLVRNLCASHVDCGGCCGFQRPPASFRRVLALATFRKHRAESIASLPGRPFPFVHNDISRRDQRQGCRRENEERARLILLLNIESVYLNLSTFFRGSPASETAWRCSPVMNAHITLVIEVLMRMPSLIKLDSPLPPCAENFPISNKRKPFF